MNNSPRLTLREVREVLLNTRPIDTGGGTTDMEMTRHVLRMFADTVPRMQVFDFGAVTRLGSTDRKMAAELWHRGLLRLPFPTTLLTYRLEHSRVTLLCVENATIEVGETREAVNATAIIALSQREDLIRPDAFMWFDIPDGEHVRAGAMGLSLCEGETSDTFKQYTLACIGRLLTLSMLLNTKGIRKRSEPVPVKLNAKRARSGKPPLDAVTYVDLSHVTFTEGGHREGQGGEKSMHYRRGHIRHYDDGTVTWVRDCIVKADGELKSRERYQVR